MRRSYLIAGLALGIAAATYLTLQIWPSYDRLWNAISSRSSLAVRLALLTGSDPRGCDYASARMYMGAPELPLSHAISSQNSRAVELLLKAGANPNVTFGDDGTPLELALNSNDLEAVRTLLRFGADPLAAAGDKTLVAWAATEGRTAEAQLMTSALEGRDSMWRTREPRRYPTFCSK